MANLWYDTWHAAFWQTIAGRGITILAETLLVIVGLLIFVAYVTYAERKVLALAQLRRGPNVVGPFGLLQPFADGLKLMAKETIIPAGANRVLFIMAPMLTFTLALAGWAVVPFDEGWVVANINVGILYLFAISSLASTASSLPAGRRTRNTRSWAACAPRRRWCPTKSRSAS